MDNPRYTFAHLLCFCLLAPLPCAAQNPGADVGVTISSSANPGVYGQPLTLTATVTPSNATGKVTFYDGTTIVGIGTISTGTASTTSVLLPSGNRLLRAYYGGDGNNPAVRSAVTPQIVMPGASAQLKIPVAVDAAAGFGSIDTIAVGDFDGDLKPDLVLASAAYGQITILLGNGDGTFRSGATYSTGINSTVVVTGDWNGDGNVDLAVATSGAIVLMLGNGDGTFYMGTPVAAGQIVTGFAVGDFNGDGNADLAVSGTGTILNAMSVFLGNGDGTFRAPISFASQTASTTSVAGGDLNGDGNADLVFLGSTGGLWVALGNGDGTFQALTPYATGLVAGYPRVNPNVVVDDFNGDGILDLAVPAYSSTAQLDVFRGNGDGTFQGAKGLSPGLFSSRIAAFDVDGDGRVDLAFIPQGYGAISVSYGNGNGLFQPVVSLPISGTFGINTIAGADFNGDGVLDLVAGGLQDTNNLFIALGGATPDYTLSVSHGGGFTAGQIGASYQLTVTSMGADPSASAVSVIDQLPPSMTATSMAGLGWGCYLPAMGCMREDFLPVGVSYPPIVITVNVGNQTGIVSNTATVSGGGQSHSVTDVTVIAPVSPPVYTGSLDSSTCQAISGWAADANRFNQPIAVSIYDGSTLLAIIAADQPLNDAASPLGDNGLHGFSYAPASGVFDAGDHKIHVFYEAGTTELPGSPQPISCSSGNTSRAARRRRI